MKVYPSTLLLQGFHAYGSKFLASKTKFGHASISEVVGNVDQNLVRKMFLAVYPVEADLFSSVNHLDCFLLRVCTLLRQI